MKKSSFRNHIESISRFGVPKRVAPIAIRGPKFKRSLSIAQKIRIFTGWQN
jgi:hypothetical protein